MVNVRADGIAVVLGPLLRDVRIVAAALVDVDSGMVLDAWSAAATDATTGSPDLELIGAQHAEIVRTALALLHSWPAGGGAPGTCEVVLGADGGARHLLRTVPDPLRRPARAGGRRERVASACSTACASGWRRCRSTR